MEKSNTAGLLTRPSRGPGAVRPRAAAAPSAATPAQPGPARHSDSTSCCEFPGWKLKDQKVPGRTMCKIPHQHQQQHPPPSPMEAVLTLLQPKLFLVVSSRILSQVFSFLARDGTFARFGATSPGFPRLQQHLLLFFTALVPLKRGNEMDQRHKHTIPPPFCCKRASLGQRSNRAGSISSLN